MAKITYVEFNGTEHSIDVASGLSVMQGAVNHNVRGIIAECGGACSCATCHVYVDQAWVGRLPPPELEESDMLDTAHDLKENSRLSCQIRVTEELDGLIVTTPPRQI